MHIVHFLQLYLYELVFVDVGLMVYNFTFDIHLEVIKQHMPKDLRRIYMAIVDELYVDLIVLWARLNYEAGFFKITMIGNVEETMQRSFEVNPFICQNP